MISGNFNNVADNLRKGRIIRLKKPIIINEWFQKCLKYTLFTYMEIFQRANTENLMKSSL